eukprot:1190244-Prorocentrum_minimum.AAC.6
MGHSLASWGRHYPSRCSVGCTLEWSGASRVDSCTAPTFTNQPANSRHGFRLMEALAVGQPRNSSPLVASHTATQPVNSRGPSHGDHLSFLLRPKMN